LAVSTVDGSVDDATMAAVAAEMDASGAQVIDLIPGDIPAEQALAYLRRVDVEQLGEDPCYAPGGVGEAVGMHSSVAERMGLPTGVERLDRGAMVRRTTKAQRYAPYTSVVRVAPGLRASRLEAQDRWREMEELLAWTRPYYSMTGAAQGLELAWLAMLAVAPWLAPLPGLAALAAWSAQPTLVFGGEEKEEGLTPPGLLGASLLRLPRAVLTGLATAAVGVRASVAKAEQPATTVETPKGFDDLFEPRRESCPWCDSSDLELLVEVPDLLQNRPGTFHLDKCGRCGHVFQNPLLTQEGIELAYDESYGGAGLETAEWFMARCQPGYWGRAQTVARFTEPRRWLDVGCAHAYFSLIARKMFPDATVDGLDMGETVEEAHRRGWVDTAHRGRFVDLAGSLPSYDVLSMHHYLEHTPDPRAELAGVDQVLEPGGYLMIELPDPEAPWARRLGRYWWQWAQPQHLHFIPCDNLVAELSSTGYEVLSVQRGSPTFGNDLVTGIGMWTQSVSRPTEAPWLPPPTTADRLKRATAVGAVLPLLPFARLVDLADEAWAQRTDAVSNCFRVVARKTA
jgi:SAM-dependent methyltransferase